MLTDDLSHSKSTISGHRRALGVKCKCNQQWCPQEGGRNLRALVSPERTSTLLYFHINTQPVPAFPPSQILTDSSAPASAPSELSSLRCLFLLPIIQSDSVLPSHPLSFRFLPLRTDFSTEEEVFFFFTHSTSIPKILNS